MSLGHAIAKNTVLQSVGKFVGLALSLLSVGLIFPYLGESGVGQYTAILSLLQIFGTLMDFGLYIVLIQRLARIDDTTPYQVSAIVTLRILSGVVFLSLAPVTAWILGRFSDFYSQEIIVGVCVTSLFFLFISINQLLSAIFQKFLHTGWIALAELVGKCVLLVLSIVAVVMGWNLLLVMSTLVFSSGIHCALLFFASRRYIHITWRVDWAVWKSVFAEAWPIGISIAFALLYFKGDTVLLTLYESADVIGEYGAPYKILEVLITFPAIFTGLVLPQLTAAWQEKNTERFTHVLQKSFDLLSAVALPLIGVTMILAPFMMDVLVPSGFENSDRILRILIIATGSIFIGTLFGYAVPALGKQRLMMWCYIVIALLSLGAYLIVIPRYSIDGAAWMTVLSELAVLFCATWIVLRTTKTKLQWTPFIKILFATSVMIGLLAIVTPYTTTLLESLALSPRFFAVSVLALLLPVAGICYGALLLLMKVVSIDDVMGIVRKKKMGI